MTVLFADIVGSTALGEQHDPETVRALLTRHFANVRSTLERHGGTVEKFIGDAVMAVFGIPKIHEDDALRAVRAAVDLRDGVQALNRRPDATAQVSVRIGINTGEVVAGDPALSETLVTGDTVNTAARLEQAAEAGEIVIGERTLELVRDAIVTEPMPPLELRGKAAPVAAHRVLEVVGEEGHRRMLEAPMVGRDAELGRLLDTWRSATASGTARLVTLLAPAGVGKSRLLRELGTSIGSEATVVRGRCLPYGDGITYWPIRELMFGLAGIAEADDRGDAIAKLEAALAADDSQRVVRIVAGAIGLEALPARQEEIFWAVRRVLESSARSRPLAAFVEDLHWAEPTLLDLLEYVVEMSIQPMMIVATGRPELLSDRPGWGTGAHAELVRLEPLTGGSATDLLLAQPGAAALPAELRTRILDAAEGNPLYVEEMVGMLRDRGALRETGDGGWAIAAGTAETEVPPTIQALLAARLDELPLEERVVAEHGAVIGRSFEAAAVGEIGPDELRVDLGRRLLALVRKELLRPDRSVLSDGDAFRFRHILIRDAAYIALPKAERAALHERFADWLERAAGDRIGEFQEIIGYHLEQAVLHRRAVALPDSETSVLGQRAALALRGAGRRARLRQDHRATASLLRRATSLATTRDVELGHDLRHMAQACRRLGLADEERSAMAELDQLLSEVPDRELRLWRTLSAARDAHTRAEAGSVEWLQEAASSVLAEAREADLPGLQATALIELGFLALQAGRPMDEFRLAEQAEAIARRDPDPEPLRFARMIIANRLPNLDIPVDEASARLRAMLDEEDVDAELRGIILLSLAYFAAADDRLDEARDLLSETRTNAEELGYVRPFLVADWPGCAYNVETLAENHNVAEEHARAAIAEMVRLDDRWHLSQAAPALAWTIAIQTERLDDARAAEVEQLIELGQRSAPERDPMNEAVARRALARLALWRGEHREAERLASEAVRLATANGIPDETIMTLLDLATIVGAAGRHDEALKVAELASQLTTSKKLRAHLRLVDALIAELRSSHRS